MDVMYDPDTEEVARRYWPKVLDYEWSDFTVPSKSQGQAWKFLDYTDLTHLVILHRDRHGLLTCWEFSGSNVFAGEMLFISIKSAIDAWFAYEQTESGRDPNS